MGIFKFLFGGVNIMTLKKEQFGKLDNGENVEKVTLTNKNGVSRADELRCHHYFY